MYLSAVILRSERNIVPFLSLHRNTVHTVFITRPTKSGKESGAHADIVVVSIVVVDIAVRVDITDIVVIVGIRRTKP